MSEPAAWLDYEFYFRGQTPPTYLTLKEGRDRLVPRKPDGEWQFEFSTDDDPPQPAGAVAIQHRDIVHWRMTRRLEKPEAPA